MVDLTKRVHRVSSIVNLQMFAITTDVYEEAKRHITSMREERDKANNQHTNARTSQNYPDPSSDNYDSKSANVSCVLQCLVSNCN